MHLMSTNVLPSYSFADVETPYSFTPYSSSNYPAESHILPHSSVIHLHPSEIPLTFAIAEVQRTDLPFSFHAEAYASVQLNETIEFEPTETYSYQLLKTETSTVHAEHLSPTFQDHGNVNNIHTPELYESWNQMGSYEIEISKTNYEEGTAANVSIAPITTLPILNTGI